MYMQRGFAVLLPLLAACSLSVAAAVGVEACVFVRLSAAVLSIGVALLLHATV